MRELRTALLEALQGQGPERSLGAPSPVSSTRHQALLMLKPECFLQGPTVARAVVDLIMAGVAGAGATLTAGVVLEGPLLGRLGTIDRHYKLASELSRSASRLVGPEDQARLHALFGVEATLPILGGHEYLAQDPSLSPEALDAVWFAQGPRKLRSGFYGVPFQLKGAPILLVNGFYPGQAHHFTAPGRQVALLVLETDRPWRVLRREMLGETYPEKALPGSIRHTLLAQKDSLGLPRVDITTNFVHLSAGPLEGAWELLNFFSGLETTAFPLARTRLAAQWTARGLDLGALETLLRRGTWPDSGKDLYAETEEMEVEEALELAGTRLASCPTPL